MFVKMQTEHKKKLNVLIGVNALASEQIDVFVKTLTEHWKLASSLEQAANNKSVQRYLFENLNNRVC